MTSRPTGRGSRERRSRRRCEDDVGEEKLVKGAGAGTGEEGVSSRLGVELEHWFSEQREMSLRVLGRPA